ncbi:MAG: hypothetical protein IJA27_08020 [Lachnospiraceae bacterium]|nr:hypothetical protein [Lachnospiraceae bacterium]
MKWYNHLYVGENAKKRKHKIIMRAIRHKPQVGVYMITLPMNENDALDIFPSYILLQKHYKKKNVFVVGIGEGREETLQLMQEIILDCYHKTGQFLVRKMIEEEQKKK